MGSGWSKRDRVTAAQGEKEQRTEHLLCAHSSSSAELHNPLCRQLGHHQFPVGQETCSRSLETVRPCHVQTQKRSRDISEAEMIEVEEVGAETSAFSISPLPCPSLPPICPSFLLPCSLTIMNTYKQALLGFLILLGFY